MPREVPPGRIADLVRRATEVFIARGYRQTQMSDVADALGVAKGTVYLYVESKEALFDLVCRFGDRPDDADAASDLPIRTPKAGATLKFVRDELGRRQELPALSAALARKRVTDPRGELRAIVTELYDQLAANRCRIKLIDTSARDYPELAALWFEGARGGLLAALREYLASRIQRGQVPAVPDVATAARLVLETTVFWAVHRHYEANPQTISDELARETVVHFVVRALAKE
jgi:AcrR family transcriptional regulator